jgi:hypothetical protein
MKTIMFAGILLAGLSIKVNSQSFISDSICYRNFNSTEKIRCDIPYIDDNEYYHDLWTIERNGDFIKIANWFFKPVKDTYIDEQGDTMQAFGSGIVHNFRIEYRNEEEVTYQANKIKVSSQTFQGKSSNGMKTINLTLGWNLYDIDNDGKWDRLILDWLEPNSPILRDIYCHFK